MIFLKRAAAVRTLASGRVGLKVCSGRGIYTSMTALAFVIAPLLVDELQGKLNLPRGPNRFADHFKSRAFDRVRRQAHVHHVEHIEEFSAELKVGMLHTTASMGNDGCFSELQDLQSEACNPKNPRPALDIHPRAGSKRSSLHQRSSTLGHRSQP
jgi:hypothetical protein